MGGWRGGGTHSRACPCVGPYHVGSLGAEGLGLGSWDGLGWTFRMARAVSVQASLRMWDDEK